jgi:hypothetical protein
MTTKRTASKMSKDGYINPYTNYGDDGKLISLDFENNVIERTEYDHPYSFSTRCTWAILGEKRKEIEKLDTLSGVYSDRLFQADALAYNMACRSVWGNEGQYFDSRRPKDVEKMLQLIYSNSKLKLYRILKTCNVGNGYPVWYFHFYTEE